MIERPRSNPRPRAEPGFPRLRVFVVENHHDTRALLCLMVEALGHAVVAAETMDQALHALAHEPYDVLISDIGLPDGDGWELMRRLNGRQPRYAVALSGFSMNADCARSHEVGFRHHLVKPHGIEQLPSVLREAARECRRAPNPAEQRAMHL
jgi:two-component system CheB/CheR fusion protein